MPSEHALNEFLRQYADDRCSGTQRPLAEYQALFPGQDEVIAERYAVYEGAPSDEGGSTAAGGLDNFGPYRIIRELGRGGQGIVYLAEDGRLHRKVALKVLTGLGVLSPDRVTRFLREAEVVSRLDHPGIATVYELGAHGGVPYIAMRYVDGETLGGRIERARNAGGAVATVTDVALIAERVARALHAAHEAGIVHRDVKPGNILVTSSADPVVVDFGLAHDAEGELGAITRTGDFFGTPAYMSPEQIAIQRTAPDRRTDVWSLGATLYECLTLSPPFSAPTREQLYREILTREPRDVRRINRSVSDDLAAIVETALAKETARRYQTAAAMADDLAAFVDGRPVAARRTGPIGTCARWARREPAKAALLFGALILLPLIAVLLTEHVVNRDKVEAARLAIVEEQKDELLSQGYFEMGEDDPDRAVATFRRALDLEGGSPEAVAGIVLLHLRRDRAQEAGELLDAHDEIRGLRAGTKMRAVALRKLGQVADAESLERSLPPCTSALEFYLEAAEWMDQGHGGHRAAFAQAIGCVRQAIYRSSKPRPLYFEVLAHAAMHAGDVETAREVAPVLRARWPRSARCQYWAGNAFQLWSPDEAIAAFQDTVAIDPGFAEAWTNMGLEYMKQARPDDAIACYRAALAIKPGLAAALYNLGVVLTNTGQLDEALACHRKAIAGDPAHGNVGVGWVFLKKGLFDEAMTSFREAIRFDPASDVALEGLGAAQVGAGLIPDAISSFRKAVSLAPTRAGLHRLLGGAFLRNHDFEGAIASCREALRLDPGLAEASCNLGHALARSGQLDAALEAMRRGHEIGSQRAGWQYSSAAWVAEIEEQVRAERRMLAIAEGKKSAEGTSDVLGLARLAALTRRWSLAARWYEAVLDDKTRSVALHDDCAVKAAQAVVQLASLEAPAISRVSTGEAGRLRERALGWLQDELRRQRDDVDNGSDVEASRRVLREWLEDPLLAPVRDGARLSMLPRPEAGAWTSFWAAVHEAAGSP